MESIDTGPNETLGKLKGQTIKFVEYGIDKNEFEINGTICWREKDVFNFVRFNCENLNLAIFECSATGLGVSDDPAIILYFEETFDKYVTN